MGSSEFLTKLQDLITLDADVKAYCQTNYGKDPLVFLGSDDEDPPDPETDYPVIVIFAVDRDERGEGDNITRYSAEVGVGIVNDTVETGVSGKKTYPGKKQAEELRELVEDAIFKRQGAGDGGNLIGLNASVDIVGGSQSDALFPIFRSDTVIQLKRKRTSRNPLGR